MRVAIDAQALGTQSGGDETFLRNLIGALSVIDSTVDYTLYLARPLPFDHPLAADRMKRVIIPHRLFRRTPVYIPFAAAQGRINVLHAQYAGPPFSQVPVVVTIHDISFESYPEFFTYADLLHMRAFVPFGARRAARVLTGSEFSKNDIVQRYRIPPERVIVAPYAAAPHYRHLNDPALLQRVRERYGTGEQFILCVGNLQPRKNIVALIKAYTYLRTSNRITHKLVVVGKKGWLYNEIFSAAHHSQLTNDLIFTGYVPDDDLVALYNAADVFVYPSIFEGFGLPPLEAMACGTPVITSNTASLPEVVGDAGLTIDPRNVDELISAMNRVLTDTLLRAELSRRGLQRAALFSWDRCARLTLEMYRSVI